MNKFGLADFLRCRVIEYFAWSGCLVLLGMTESICAGASILPPWPESALFDATYLVAFSTIYVYVLFLYPVLSLTAYILSRLVQGPKPVVSMLVVNVLVPVLFGSASLVSIYGRRQDVVHLIAFSITVITNSIVTALLWRRWRGGGPLRGGDQVTSRIS